MLCDVVDFTTFVPLETDLLGCERHDMDILTDLLREWDEVGGGTVSLEVIGSGGERNVYENLSLSMIFSVPATKSSVALKAETNCFNASAP